MNPIRDRFVALAPRTRWIFFGAVTTAALFVLLLTRRGSNETGVGTRTSAAAGDRGSDAAMPGMKANSGGAVKLTAAQISQFGVTFGMVALRPLSTDVRTVGTVMVDETRVAKVTSKFSGYVERLNVNFVGQAVHRGQTLAQVFSPDLLAAEQELLLAAKLSRTVEGSSVPGVPSMTGDLVVPARQRLRLWDVSDAEINRVLQTGRPIRTVALSTPTSGIVTDKKVVQGQAIQAGEELYTITDLSSVWLEAQVREGDAGVVAPGTAAVIELAAYPGRAFTGRVSYVYPVLSAEARTVAARIVVPNPDGRLKPGMYATVRLNTSTQTALTIPRSAVVQTGERSIVFVDAGGGELVPREVRLGRSGSDFIEVLVGLRAGQRVVTSAQFLIDSESNLADVMRSMVGNGNTAGTREAKQSGPENLNEKGADLRGTPQLTTPPKSK